MRYISPERKISEEAGTGIQYIPGHDEPFVDLVVADYLPKAGPILDLGGGGLRFAIPAAATGRKIIVVDVDSTGMAIDAIVERVNANGKVSIRLSDVKDNISCQAEQAFRYLARTTQRFSLITAFRLAHFFNPGQMSRFLSLVSDRLSPPNGLLAISAMAPTDTSAPQVFNEFYLHSAPASRDCHLYRTFLGDSESCSTRMAQNLPESIHFVDDGFIRRVCRVHGLEIVRGPFPATRVVLGYVLRKTPRNGYV